MIHRRLLVKHYGNKITYESSIKKMSNYALKRLTNVRARWEFECLKKHDT